MKRLAIVAVLIAGFLASLAQGQRQLSPEDQTKFDSYYTRWQEYKATKTAIRSPAWRSACKTSMVHYKIPLTVPYHAIATRERR